MVYTEEMEIELGFQSLLAWGEEDTLCVLFAFQEKKLSFYLSLFSFILIQGIGDFNLFLSTFASCFIFVCVVNFPFH